MQHSCPESALFGLKCVSISKSLGTVAAGLTRRAVAQPANRDIRVTVEVIHQATPNHQAETASVRRFLLRKQNVARSGNTARNLSKCSPRSDPRLRIGELAGGEEHADGDPAGWTESILSHREL